MTNLPVLSTLPVKARKRGKFAHFLACHLLLAKSPKLQYHNTQSAYDLRNHRDGLRTGRTDFMQASRGWVMEKKLSIGSMAVAGVMLLLFLLDLFVHVPFGGGGFVSIDVIGALASAILAFLGFSAYRDVR